MTNNLSSSILYDKYDLLFGSAIVPEYTLISTDVIFITPRKLFKDKITIEKRLVIDKIEKLLKPTTAIIEYK